MKSVFAMSIAFGVYAGPLKLKGTESENFQLFQNFIREHGREYDTPKEFDLRFAHFQDFLDIADKRNAEEFEASGQTDVHGITQFADWSQKEFADKMLMKPGFYTPRNHTGEPLFVPPKNMASNVDWRNQGVVTAVKNQAQCGSCWAFSATEAVESFGMIQNSMSSLIALSTEQSCSCTYSYNGCNGGNPQNVYGTAIQKNGGEESDAEYGYTMNCGTCGVSSSKTKYVSTNGYTNAPKGSLQSVLDSQGPPSVCVAAESWNTYRGGVMTTCRGTIDHCVQAVGYTTSSSPSYWLVRNSWGTSWGEKGYIYLNMDGDTCHVQDDVNYPKTVSV